MKAYILNWLIRHLLIILRWRLRLHWPVLQRRRTTEIVEYFIDDSVEIYVHVGHRGGGGAVDVVA